MSTTGIANANITGHQAAANLAGEHRRAIAYRDPFSHRAEEIARQAILRADTLGMHHYGPAPPPLEEKRDMIQEAIEELYDSVYYLCRQVAKLEDLRKKLSSVGGDKTEGGHHDERKEAAYHPEDAPPACP